MQFIEVLPEESDYKMAKNWDRKNMNGMSWQHSAMYKPIDDAIFHSDNFNSLVWRCFWCIFKCFRSHFFFFFCKVKTKEKYVFHLIRWCLEHLNMIPKVKSLYTNTHTHTIVDLGVVDRDFGCTLSTQHMVGGWETFFCYRLHELKDHDITVPNQKKEDCQTTVRMH